MAWSTPMTAVAGAVFTAAEFNQYVRNNLLETGPAKVTTQGDLLVATGLNALGRYPVGSNIVATTQSTSSVLFTDLATVGPTVTLNTVNSATVIISALGYSATSTHQAEVGVALSGTNSMAASSTRSLIMRSPAGGTAWQQLSYVTRFTGLTPGSTTFTLKYRSPDGSSVTFSGRALLVLPF